MQRKMNTCLRPHLEKHEQKTVRESKRDKDGFTTVKQQADVSHERGDGADTSAQPTCADKLLLLHLGHVVPPQVRRGHALRVKTQTGALSQPLRQPGHVAVTLQVVGVQATGGRKEGEEGMWREQVGGSGGGGGGGGIIDLRMGETGAGREEEGETRAQIDQSIVQTGRDERNASPLGGCVANTRRCHLQGPELRHVVETGHRQSADVVVVEGAEERKERKTQGRIDSLDSSAVTRLLNTDTEKRLSQQRRAWKWTPLSVI